MTDRKRARELANEAIAAGEPLAWFERLYREAESERAVVPWADLRPNPHVVAWLDAASRELRGRALVVGVVARGRDESEDPGSMPWLLTRAEVEAMATDGTHLLSFEDFTDDEALPVRRFRAVFEREAVGEG